MDLSHEVILFVLSLYLELGGLIETEEEEESCSITIEIDGEIMNSQKYQAIIEENRELRDCERSLYHQNRILEENEARLEEENLKLKQLANRLAEELSFIYES